MKKKKNRITFRKVWELHLKPANLDANCTSKHMAEIERHLLRWETFWHGGKEPSVKKCTRQDMVEYRRHLLGMNKFSARSINKHLGSIRSLLVAADKNGLIKRRPKLEQLPPIAHDQARKIYLRDEQLNELMETAHTLEWPPESITGMPTADWWRCAIVMYRTYGFRTQELLAYEPEKKPLTWENIVLDSESPNPTSDMKNDFGWLQYVPPKTKKKKPTPIYLPLTRHSRAAIDKLQRCRTANHHFLFPMPRSQERFLGEWYRWFNAAKVKPKIPGAKFKPYHMRKTCATYLSEHHRGLATAVCRWGSDSDEAKVALDHYISDDRVVQHLLTAPMPKSFDLIL